jgi:hypothetical protein
MSEIKQWDVVSYGQNLGIVTQIYYDDLLKTELASVFSPTNIRFMDYRIDSLKKEHDKVAIAPSMVMSRSSATGIIRRVVMTSLYTFEEYQFARDNYSTEEVTWSWPYSITSLVIVDKT